MTFHIPCIFMQTLKAVNKKETSAPIFRKLSEFRLTYEIFFQVLF